jgi:hypothetical protein
VNGKCTEFVDKTTRLIAKEVDHTFDAKIFVISLNVNKTFLAKHLLDDNGNGKVELLHGEQFK